MGYFFDSNTKSIHRVVGIPENARIEESMDLGFAITQAAILPSHNHVLVDSPDNPELFVFDLETRSTPLRINEAPSSVSSIRLSGNGAAAALYYAQSRKILILGGLPDSPAVRETIDVSTVDLTLSRYAVTNDGTLALLAFSEETQDVVYRWTRNSGLAYLDASGRVSEITFMDEHAVLADFGAGQIRMLRNVRDEATPTVIGDAREGLSQPVAISISRQHEILVADAGTGRVVTLDVSGRKLREVQCACVPTNLSVLRGSIYRLTDRIESPIFVFDSNYGTDRISFIPALSRAGRDHEE